LRIALHVMAFGMVLALCVAFLGLSGYDVGVSLGALWRGAFGSLDAFVSSTLVRAIPLILLGTAVALTFRVGVFNIGGDGQFLAGAAAATWIVLLPDRPGVLSLVLGLLAGAAAGATWGLMPAFMLRRWKVFEVLSTLMLNFVAAFLISYLVRGPLQEPTRIYPQSSSVPLSAQLPILIPGSRLHLGFVLAILCAVGTWIWLTYREAGFRARLTGANPRAAASAARIHTQSVAFRVFVAGAALGGLAGAVEVLGVSFALYENLSPGYGFTAIAVALLAGLNPLGVLASAAILAGLDAGANTMQRDAAVPAVTAWVVQALLVLTILALRAVAGRRRLLASGMRA
jgi:simple sugar transport system permease protein